MRTATKQDYWDFIKSNDECFTDTCSPELENAFARYVTDKYPECDDEDPSEYVIDSLCDYDYDKEAEIYVEFINSSEEVNTRFWQDHQAALNPDPPSDPGAWEPPNSGGTTIMVMQPLRQPDPPFINREPRPVQRPALLNDPAEDVERPITHDNLRSAFRILYENGITDIHEFLRGDGELDVIMGNFVREAMRNNVPMRTFDEREAFYINLFNSCRVANERFWRIFTDDYDDNDIFSQTF